MGVLFAPRSGVLLHIEHTHLVDVARKADVQLEVVPALGDFVHIELGADPVGRDLERIEVALHDVGMAVRPTTSDQLSALV